MRRNVRKWSCWRFLLLLLLGMAATPDFHAGDELDLWVGQMLMVGFRGTELPERDPFLRQLEELHLGGVVLFDYDVPSRSPVRNILDSVQVRRLTERLHASSSTPLLIAIDQEGGKIARLKPARGFPPTLSQARLGNLDDEGTTRDNARTIGTTLRDLGINVNFAPVLDLAVNPENPVIAKLERSYGPGTERVVRHARWTIEEFHKAGILSAVKHFPGHGSSLQDSHLGLPDVSRAWQEDEIEPFRLLIGEGLPDLVMTAHLFNQRWDRKYPATLSHQVITGLLRGKLGFQGVIVSDDLQMAAITKQYGLEETVELAVKAGVDILLVGNNQEYDPSVVPRVTQTLKSLVTEGRIARERIEASYDRISRLKQKLKDLERTQEQGPR